MFNRLKDFQFLGDGQSVMFNTEEKCPKYLSHLSYVRLNEALNLLLLHSIKKKFFVIEPLGVQ